MNYGIVKQVLIAFVIRVICNPIRIRYDQVFTQIKIRSVYPGRRTRITSEEIRDSDDGRTDHITWNRNRIVILC